MTPLSQVGSQAQDSIHVTEESSDIVAENMIFHTAGCLVKGFFTKKLEGCVCDQSLRVEDTVLPAGPHHFLLMLKENNVP